MQIEMFYLRFSLRGPFIKFTFVIDFVQFNQWICKINNCHVLNFKGSKFNERRNRLKTDQTKSSTNFFVSPFDWIFSSYFSTPRNGYSAGLDARFSSFKAAAATPYVSLIAPLGAVGPQVPTQQATTAKEAKDNKLQSLAESSSVTNNIFGSPTNLFPPMLDMSSTQALLHMVRTANAAQNAPDVESYLKGANKRETSLSSPLDLSNR